MRRAKRQKGYIFRRGNWWMVRYRETVMENGQLVRRQAAKQIERVLDEHTRLRRPPEEIKVKAKAMLDPINNKTAKPEATQTIQEFVTAVYFPSLEKMARVSTVKFCKSRWGSQLKARCGDYQLRDFRTVDGQTILNQIASENPKLMRRTLIHFRNVLSGIFSEAIRLGYLDGQVTLHGTTKTVIGNPMRGVRIPNAPEGEDTYAYSLEEVSRILAYLPQPAHTICAVAAFTGLRRSELSGLVWENYDGDQISVTRSVWEGHVNEPKTRKSKAPVPVIAPLRKILDAYSAKCGNPASGIMFASEKGTPLRMNNVVNRMILPSLKNGEWHGWHAFRRGLATNLHRLGVDDKSIQAILRHSNITTTQNVYIKTVSSDSVVAMKLLESLLCTNCAPEPSPTTDVRATVM